jgi:F-type H+-transporting ATPase subunit a
MYWFLDRLSALLHTTLEYQPFFKATQDDLCDCDTNPSYSNCNKCVIRLYPLKYLAISRYHRFFTGTLAKNIGLEESMITTPLSSLPLFSLGNIPIHAQVVSTWVIMLTLYGLCRWISHHLTLQSSKVQTLVELLVSAFLEQIRTTLNINPQPYLPVIGGLFLYILCANLSSLIPGHEPPTAHIETDAALAIIVFLSVLVFGVRSRGCVGYIKSFAEPNWFMLPLNIVEAITRTFSLMIRLFGNIMSGTFIIGIMLSLAGFLVPIPFMALDILIGIIQAYIFGTLALIFIGAALGEPNIGADQARKN